MQRVPLDKARLITPEPDFDVLAVDRALEAFAKIDPRKSQVVELRFFGGLSVEETAAVLGYLSGDRQARLAGCQALALTGTRGTGASSHARASQV